MNTNHQPEDQKVIVTVKKSLPAVVSIIISKNVPRVEGKNFFGNYDSIKKPWAQKPGTKKAFVGGGSGFIRGVAEILPFIDNSIDVITAIESIDHFFDPKRSIKEMLRCLAPGGGLFIFTGDGSVKSKAYIDRQRFFTITEDDVHTYNFSTNYFQELLYEYFETLEIDRENDYMAIWGWNKIPRAI